MIGIVILSFLDIIFQRKCQLVTSYSLKLQSTVVFKVRLCQIVNMLMTKPERMYIHKHCIFHCNKSKTIHGSTPV